MYITIGYSPDHLGPRREISLCEVDDDVPQLFVRLGEGYHETMRLSVPEASAMLSAWGFDATEDNLDALLCLADDLLHTLRVIHRTGSRGNAAGAMTGASCAPAPSPAASSSAPSTCSAGG